MVARAVCVGLFALPLLACRADVRVQVALTPAGSGSVTASLVLDRQAVAVGGGSVEVGDLRRDGWTVAGPAGAPDGSETITVSHAFATADQAAALLGRIGPGFQLSVAHHHATASSSVGLGGVVDLRGGIDTLAGGPGSAAAAGAGLGGALAAVTRAGGTVPTVSAAVVARMPSHPTGVLGGGTVAGNTVTWTVPIGTSTAIGATSVRTDTTARRWLAAAAALVVALLVVVAVQAVVARGRTRR